LEYDALLVADGREVNVDGMELEAAGVEFSRAGGRGGQPPPDK